MEFIVQNAIKTANESSLGQINTIGQANIKVVGCGGYTRKAYKVLKL